MSLILRSLFLVVISSCCTNAATGNIGSELLLKVNSCLAQECVELYHIVVTLPSVQEEVLSSKKHKKPHKKSVNRTQTIQADLKTATAKSQKSFLMQLTNLNLQSITVEPFWIRNIISIEGLTASDVRAIADTFSGTFFIAEPTPVDVDQEETTTAKAPCSVEKDYGAWYYLGDLSQYQWGVNAVLGPSAWFRANGAGITVMVVDTGINADHEAFQVYN
jgi:hypothetical protein